MDCQESFNRQLCASQRQPTSDRHYVWSNFSKYISEWFIHRCKTSRCCMLYFAKQSCASDTSTEFINVFLTKQFSWRHTHVFIAPFTLCFSHFLTHLLSASPLHSHFLPPMSMRTSQHISFWELFRLYGVNLPTSGFCWVSAKPSQ